MRHACSVYSWLRRWSALFQVTEAVFISCYFGLNFSEKELPELCVQEEQGFPLSMG